MTENPAHENPEHRSTGPEEDMPPGEDYTGHDSQDPAAPALLHPSMEELVMDHSNQLVDLGNMVTALIEAFEAGQKEGNEKIGQIGTLVTDLSASVKKLTERPKASEPDEWNTKHLPGPATAELLDKVRDWVDWYNARYGVAESIRIRPCWYMHPPVIEELTALWVAWRAAYYGHNKPDTAATYWHSAYLWPTIKRINTEPWGQHKCFAAHEHPREVTSTSTDSGYTAVRAALTSRTDTPVIPWPGQNTTTARPERAPHTAPIPAQRPTFGATR